MAEQIYLVSNPFKQENPRYLTKEELGAYLADRMEKFLAIPNNPGGGWVNCHLAVDGMLTEEAVTISIFIEDPEDRCPQCGCRNRLCRC